jgi:AcrR family transcriptional regulator
VTGSEANSRRHRLTRAEAKARTREQLLDAAAQVFARKGYSGASVEEIAEAAGYSTGALYSNFDSKQELFIELMSERRSRRIARRAAELAEILDRDTAEGHDLLAALMQSLEKISGRSAEAAVLQAEFWLYAVRNPEVMQLLSGTTDERISALAPVVTRVMQRYGVSPEISAETLTRITLALYQGLARQRRVHPDAVPADLITQALHWLLAGMRTTATPAQRPNPASGPERPR